MTDYRLHDPDKGIIGPIRLATVRDLVDAGVIHDGVWVSRNNGPFLPISAFAEIAPQPEDESSQELQPTYSGDLGKNTFFKVLFRFHVTRATGLLALQGEIVRKEIYLVSGEPTYVSSTDPNERLGEYLMQKQKITPEDLEHALGAMHSDDNHLGYSLVRLGLMDPEDLYRALRAQQIERLVDLCTWPGGRYLFFEGERFTGDMVDLQLDVGDLIVRAARGLSLERLAERIGPHMDHIAEPLPDQQIVPLNELGLADFERRVMMAVDGQRTIRQILGNLDKKQRRAALVVIYLLWEIDAIGFRE